MSIQPHMMEKSSTAWKSRYRFIIGLAVILLLSAGARLYQIDGFSTDFDEGIYLMTAWLQARGLPLYTEVVAVQPPLLFQPIAWLFALWGPSSTIARCLEVGYALLGIAAIAYAGKLLWGPATGLLAALFLSLERDYFVHSREFIGTVPSAAVGTLAMLAGLYFGATGRRRWLLAAGALLSFSLLIKPLSLSVGLLLVWMIVARRRSEMPATVTGRQMLRSFPWRAALLDALAVGAAGLILPLLCLVFYDGPAMLQQMTNVMSQRFSGRREDWITYLLTGYVHNNLPLLLLAALGIIQTIRRRTGLGMTIIVWLVLNFVFIVATQAQQHHLVLLDLPLALLAAQPVGETINLVLSRRLRSELWSGLAAASLFAYYAVSFPSILAIDFAEHPRGADWPGDKDWRAAVRLLQEVTAPDQFIISDDQELVFEARRTALPTLIDTSKVVIQSGALKEQTVMQLADQRAAAIVFWTGRLDMFPMLGEWARWAYAQNRDFGQKRIIYYDKQTPKISHSLNLTFGGEIALTGYDWSSDTPPHLILYWRKLVAQAGDYTMSLRLLDKAGNLVAQHDDRPYGGRFPTIDWPVGTVLPETVEVPSAQAFQPGKYSLVIGLYNPVKPDLLPVSGGPAQNGLALLEDLTLEGQ